MLLQEREKFRKLLDERDHFNRKLLHRAFFLADGNIVKMASGMQLSRGSLYKYLRESFGEEFKHVLIGYGDPDKK